MVEEQKSAAHSESFHPIMESSPSDQFHSNNSYEFQSLSPNESFISSSSLKSPPFSLDSDKPATKRPTPSNSSSNSISITTGNCRKSPAWIQKRAQQNRNAQKAFRERKERYILSLESKIQELEGRLENESRLQGRLADLECEIHQLKCENQKLRIAIDTREILESGSLLVARDVPTMPALSPSFLETWHETPDRQCYNDDDPSLNSFSDSSTLMSFLSPHFTDTNEHSSFELKLAFADLTLSYPSPTQPNN